MKYELTEYGVAGVVLAGGRARRMGGTPKGMLRAGGHSSLIERIIAHMLRSGIKEVVIAANDKSSYAHVGCAVIPDSRPDAGPLAGIEAALAYFAGRHDAILCVPCDLPALSAREMQTLMNAFSASSPPVLLAETEGRMRHPLCAVIRADVLSRISAALNRGLCGADDLWRSIGCGTIHFDNSQAFINLNTPQDVDVWLAGQESLPRRD